MISSSVGRGRRRKPLEVPRSLDRLVGARVAALDPPADDVALYAAALAQPTVPVLDGRARRGSDGGRPGRRRGGRRPRGVRRRRPTSPIRSSPRPPTAEPGPDRRRRVHERLAEVVTEPEERARHLARTAVGADASVARALEEAAAVAARRGASEVAAELCRGGRPADTRRRGRRATSPATGRGRAPDRVRRHAPGRRDPRRRSPASSRDGPLRADVLTRRALVALYLSDLELAEDAASGGDADDARTTLVAASRSTPCSPGSATCRGAAGAGRGSTCGKRSGCHASSATHLSSSRCSVTRPRGGSASGVHGATSSSAPTRWRSRSTDVPALEHPGPAVRPTARREGGSHRRRTSTTRAADRERTVGRRLDEPAAAPRLVGGDRVRRGLVGPRGADRGRRADRAPPDG